jgi:hypothetical protein
MADINQIICKVKKLQALSLSSNINEAAAAAAAANKLIDTYRLQECDLEIDIESSDPIEEDTDYLYESGKITAWKQTLVSILVRHYGCAYWNDTSYATGRKVSRYKLVGKRSDIGIIRYMFSWLTAEVTRLSDREAKGMGRVFVASYCTGFVRGVDEQLKKSRLEAQKDATSTAIIKIDGRGCCNGRALQAAYEPSDYEGDFPFADGLQCLCYGQDQGKQYPSWSEPE